MGYMGSETAYGHICCPQLSVIRGDLVFEVVSGCATRIGGVVKGEENV